MGMPSDQNKGRLMKIGVCRLIGNLATSDEVDELLRSRMKILGLDIDAISRDYHEVFDKVRKNCPRSAHTVR